MEMKIQLMKMIQDLIHHRFKENNNKNCKEVLENN